MDSRKILRLVANLLEATESSGGKCKCDIREVQANIPGTKLHASTGGYMVALMAQLGPDAVMQLDGGIPEGELDPTRILPYPTADSLYEAIKEAPWKSEKIMYEQFNQRVVDEPKEEK